MSARSLSTEYVCCPDCTHTTNIHTNTGCCAYGCRCKKGR